MRIASRIRRVPIPSALAVYSGVSKLTLHVTSHLDYRSHPVVLLNDADQICAVGQITIMQFEIDIFSGIKIQMVNTVGIRKRTSPFYTIDHVPLI